MSTRRSTCRTRWTTRGGISTPFTWQFLFAIGAATAMAMQRQGGMLPRSRPLAALCWAYLAVSLIAMVPWASWGTV
ncbi:MAG: OpgC domain-containing protein [Acetobacteraceae bacterium]|nr:OpgC domain-containing protein [Acetobacteraceae bacterium]